MKPYSIVLADDHCLIRRALKEVLKEVPDIEVIGEASNGIQLLEILKRVKPDLIILDIAMPGLNGIEVATKVKQNFSDIKLLILTMHNTKESLRLAIAAGVDGYLVKDDAEPELKKAIQTIKAGKKYISPLLSQEMTSLCFWKFQVDSEAYLRNLSKREMDVLKLIAEGKTNQEIANSLFISIRTIHRHRYNIMKKLGFKKSVDLLKYAITGSFRA